MQGFPCDFTLKQFWHRRMPRNGAYKKGPTNVHTKWTDKTWKLKSVIFSRYSKRSVCLSIRQNPTWLTTSISPPFHSHNLVVKFSFLACRSHQALPTLRLPFPNKTQEKNNKFMVLLYLRRETRRIDQSEGRYGEDAKEGTAHIVALFAWCDGSVILWVTGSTLFTRLLDSWMIVWVLSFLFMSDSLFDSLLGWLSAHIQAMGLWICFFGICLVRAKRTQHFQKKSVSSQAIMHLLFITGGKQRQHMSYKHTFQVLYP